MNKNDHRLKKDNTGQQVSEAEEEISASLMIIEPRCEKTGLRGF